MTRQLTQRSNDTRSIAHRMLHVLTGVVHELIQKLYALGFLNANVLSFGRTRGIMLHDLLSCNAPFVCVLLKIKRNIKISHEQHGRWLHVQ